MIVFYSTGISGASRNESRSPLDLYTPRFVRGIGASKVCIDDFL